MISFKKIEKHSISYYLLILAIRNHVKKIFFSSFKISGQENIPTKGTPTILVSNHQNGFIDAILILSAMPQNRYGVFLARADIFKKDFVAKILCWLRIMPIFRQRDGIENLDGNDEIINKSAQLINDGYPIYMFPEGQHQEGHFLGSIKKGFTRIAFDAAQKNNFPDNMIILPVGHHYQDYFEDRSQASLRFGKPILLKDYYDLFHKNPAKARVLLTEKVTESIKNLMIDINCPKYYEEIEFLRQIYFLQTQPSFEEEQKFIKKVVLEDQHTIFTQAKLLKKQLSILKLKIKDFIFPPNLPSLIGKTLWSLITLPLFLGASILCFIPWIISRKISANIALKIKNRMLFSTFYYILSATIFFPLFAIITTIIFAIITKSWLWTTLFAIALTPCNIMWLELLKYNKSLLSSWRFFILKRSRLTNKINTDWQNLNGSGVFDLETEVSQQK